MMEKLLAFQHLLAKAPKSEGEKGNLFLFSPSAQKWVVFILGKPPPPPPAPRFRFV